LDNLIKLPDTGAATGGVPFLGRRSPKVGASTTGAIYHVKIKLKIFLITNSILKGKEVAHNKMRMDKIVLVTHSYLKI
jgi:hypothetical protein